MLGVKAGKSSLCSAFTCSSGRQVTAIWQTRWQERKLLLIPDCDWQTCACKATLLNTNLDIYLESMRHLRDKRCKTRSEEQFQVKEGPQIFFYSLWRHFSDGWPSVKSLCGCVLDSNVWDPHSPAAKWWVTAPEGITHTAPLSSMRHIPAALGSVIGVIVWNCIKVIATAEEVVPALWHMWSIVSLSAPTPTPT